MAPSVWLSKPSMKWQSKELAWSVEFLRLKQCNLIESWTLNWKYTPNENTTLTAEVPKLLPWVFDTGDPVPWEAWQTLLSLLVGLPVQQEIKQMLGEGWEQGPCKHETSSTKEQDILFHLYSPSGTSAGTAMGTKQIQHWISTCSMWN